MIMNKFTRRILTAGVSVALVGGAVLAAGGSASAAPLTAGGHQGIVAGVQSDVRAQGDLEAHGARYQWVADQLAAFGGGRVERVHGGLDPRYFPWVSDQLVFFESGYGFGHRGLHHDTEHDERPGR
jgi:hypothetical protein